MDEAQRAGLRGGDGRGRRHRPGPLRLRRRPALRRRVGRPERRPADHPHPAQHDPGRPGRATPRASRTRWRTPWREVREIVLRLVLTARHFCTFMQRENSQRGFGWALQVCVVDDSSTAGSGPLTGRPPSAADRTGEPLPAPNIGRVSGSQRSASSSAPGKVSGLPRSPSWRTAASVKASIAKLPASSGGPGDRVGVRRRAPLLGDQRGAADLSARFATGFGSA